MTLVPADHPLRQAPIEELRLLRAMIDELMPPESLLDINLESELIRQYRRLSRLQDDTESDDDIALNQKAQLANSVSAVLQKIVDLQERLHSIEEIKRLEPIFVAVLRELPEQHAAQALKTFEEKLNESRRRKSK